jgi:hypothetical protein
MKSNENEFSTEKTVAAARQQGLLSENWVNTNFSRAKNV